MGNPTQLKWQCSTQYTIEITSCSSPATHLQPAAVVDRPCYSSLLLHAHSLQGNRNWSFPFCLLPTLPTCTSAQTANEAKQQHRVLKGITPQREGCLSELQEPLLTAAQTGVLCCIPSVHAMPQAAGCRTPQWESRKIQVGKRIMFFSKVTTVTLSRHSKLTAVQKCWETHHSV